MKDVLKVSLSSILVYIYIYMYVMYVKYIYIYMFLSYLSCIKLSMLYKKFSFFILSREEKDKCVEVYICKHVSVFSLYSM